MAANPSAAWVPPPPPARMGAGRVLAVVLGALVLLPAIGLLTGGGVLLWADTWGREDDDYLFTATDEFSTAGHAMQSDRIDLETDADWVPLSAALGTARVEVTSADAGEDVFIGVGPTADVEAYLGGVERTVIDDLGLDTSAGQELLPGGAPSGPPTQQDFWTVEASGPGTQQLSWEPADGSWTLVIMNADGSAGVSVDARIGATAPALGGLAWGILAGGLFLGLVSVLVLVLAARRRPAAATGSTYGMSPGGPPPYWTPPAPVDRTTAADAASSPVPDPAARRPPDA
ncbi:hypothetical protein [Blastococcus haudaquaticus]|uniref:Uncharacterized protein n=1 Tax=Blastococcus haudaquaticus TaxID=1938745 RepID=A0A286GXK1_9ACTN|nr:hypothetical protein [Blastococcus haudaquaticus]SOE00212.1 hypothetical protein SAMN06272739_2457 [Blastococcus haudaquaticus]